MTDGICFVGLDVHARKTAAAAVQLGSGEVFKAQLPGSPAATLQWLSTLPAPAQMAAGDSVLTSRQRRPRPRRMLATLLHEAAHALARVREIQDTSRQGRYHNQRCSTRVSASRAGRSSPWVPGDARIKPMQPHECVPDPVGEHLCLAVE